MQNQLRSTGQADAMLRRTLSALHAQIGDYKSALVEIEAALREAPDNADFHAHRSSVLFRLGEVNEAAKSIAQAVHFEPENRAIRRHAVSLYVEAGETQNALVTIANLLAEEPSNDEYASCAQHVLRLRTFSDTPAIFDILEAKRAAPPRRPRPRRGVRDALRTQGSVIGALILREMRTRFGESRFGYFWALLEPAIHVGVLALVFPITMHGTPPLGDNFFFFYFTGIIPYLLFSHTVAHLGHSLGQNRPLLQLPQVTHIDVLVARGLLEFATIFVVTVFFIAGFAVMDVDAAPVYPGQAFAALSAVWLFALGVGAINAVINIGTQLWDHVFQIVIRLLYFASGIFYVPMMMPEWVRDILSWNPLLHGVDWFRTAFFVNYQPAWLDRGYLVAAACFTILLGLTLESAFRGKLRLPQ